jgi:histone acetyltransferase (RNA polymerase elongator complex component)
MSKSNAASSQSQGHSLPLDNISSQPIAAIDVFGNNEGTMVSTSSNIDIVREQQQIKARLASLDKKVDNLPEEITAKLAQTFPSLFLISPASAGHATEHSEGPVAVQRSALIEQGQKFSELSAKTLKLDHLVSCKRCRYCN